MKRKIYNALAVTLLIFVWPIASSAFEVWELWQALLLTVPVLIVAALLVYKAGRVKHGRR